MDATTTFSSVNGTGSGAAGMAPGAASDGGAAGGAAPSGNEGGGAALKPDGPGSAAPSSSPPAQGSSSSGGDQALAETGHPVDWSKYNAEIQRATALQDRLDKLEKEHRQATEQLNLARQVQQFVPQQQAPVTPQQERKADDLFQKFLEGGRLTESEKELVGLVQQERTARQSLEQRLNNFEINQAAERIKSEFTAATQKYPDLPQELLKSVCLANPGKTITAVADELARHFDIVHEGRLSKKAQAAQAAAAQATAAQGQPSRSPPVVGTGGSGSAGKPAPGKQDADDGKDRDESGRFRRSFDDAKSNARRRLGLRD